MKIDFVSDIACPWCAVGLNALELALQRLDGELAVEIEFQPFELNPMMPPEGEDTVEHLKRKYGIDEAQIAANQAVLRERGAAVGFAFGSRPRIWNTFDAHRLLHWAGLQGRQRSLKHALLTAYHGQGRNPGALDVLVEAAQAAGLDAAQAAEIVTSGAHAREVREAEQAWQQMGIRSVPAVVIDRRHLISGGQPPEVFEQALRQIAAQGTSAGA